MESPSIMSHVSIGTNDYPRATAFYDAVMPTIGAGRVFEPEGVPEGAYAVAYGKQFPEFWVGTPHDGGRAETANGVHFAFLAPSKGYELNMGSGDNLFFDRSNNLLEFRGPQSPHGPCYRPGAYGSPVRVERLPDAVIRYITANYPDNEIRRVSTRSGHFIVAVDAPALLLFDEQGAFVEELSPIRYCQGACRPVRQDQLPAGIPAYIRANYNDSTFRQACARSGRIAVWLTNAEGRIILVFDREGNLLFVRE